MSPIMPWSRSRNLTEAELKEIRAYLRTVTPVELDVPPEPVEVNDNPLIDEHPAPAAAPGASDAKMPAAGPVDDAVEKTK